MAKKFSDEVCLANYSGICELFNKVIPDHSRFSVVYGGGVDVGMTNFVVVRKTTYTYSSYAVGFDTGGEEIVILPIDIDMESYGSPVYLKKSEIDKAKISWLSKEITIRDKRLPKKYIQSSQLNTAIFHDFFLIYFYFTFNENNDKIILLHILFIEKRRRLWYQ